MYQKKYTGISLYFKLIFFIFFPPTRGPGKVSIRNLQGKNYKLKQLKTKISAIKFVPTGIKYLSERKEMTVLASTHKVFSQGIHQSWTNELLLHQNLTSTAENAEYSYPPLAAPMHAGTEHGNNNIFRSVQWTSDGSSLVTCSEDNCIRLFIPYVVEYTMYLLF